MDWYANFVAVVNIYLQLIKNVSFIEYAKQGAVHVYILHVNVNGGLEQETRTSRDIYMPEVHIHSYVI